MTDTNEGDLDRMERVPLEATSDPPPNASPAVLVWPMSGPGPIRYEGTGRAETGDKGELAILNDDNDEFGFAIWPAGAWQRCEVHYDRRAKTNRVQLPGGHKTDLDCIPAMIAELRQLCAEPFDTLEIEGGDGAITDTHVVRAADIIAAINDHVR